MSIDSRQREVAMLRREMADLQKQDADEARKLVSKEKEAERALLSLNSTKSDSSARTYRNKLIQLKDEISKISVKRADLAKKVAQKTDSLHRSEQNLLKEQESQRKKVEAEEKKREQMQLAHHKRITNELRLQKELSIPSEINEIDVRNVEYDVFISHASEDKESFVRPLAEELTKMGFNVWYDENTLRIGDSLRQKIDQGLASSRYGIVVLSEAFFAKNWPQYELNGLVAREMQGRKVILPIWHKVSKDEVLSYSPTLADKVALNTAEYSIKEIALKLSEILDESDK